MTLPALAPSLAVAGSDASLISALLPRLSALVLLVVAGGVLVLVIRRVMQPNAASNDPGLSLDDLRRMHREGHLSDEEFEIARNQIIRAYRDVPGPRDGTGAESGQRTSPTPPDSLPEAGHSENSP